MELFIFILGIGVFVLFFWMLQTINRLNSTVTRLEKKLDCVLSHNSIEYNPFNNAPEELLASLRTGKKIEAIKLYRNFSGVGLKEAADEVERYLKSTHGQ